MKLFATNPFRSKKSKSRSISRSDDPSFSSGTTSSSSETSLHKPNHTAPPTPTSVLDISAAVYSDLVQAFSMIDIDGDGMITKEQLQTILSRVGGSEPPSEEELMLLLDEVDKNGDGCITLEEFETISSAFESPMSEGAELKDAFDFFDADHDGKITAEELFSVFGIIGDARCTLEDCRRMIRGVDKNGDGFVCFEDFCLMMEQQR